MSSSTPVPDWKRELQAQYWAIAERTDAILVNAGGYYVYANEAAARLLRARDVQEVIERSPIDVVDPRYHDIARERIRRVFKEGKTTSLLEYQWQRFDGSPVDVEVATGPVEWEGKTAALIVARDITMRKQAQALSRAMDALREAKREAERANEAKSQFLAVISHELRTPLSGVIGCASLLESDVLGSLSSEQKDAVARIRANSGHLVRIIEEILTFSRVEAGKEEVRSEETDVTEIAREVVEMLRPEAEDRPVSFRLVEPDEPAAVRTDAGKVRQILVNLAGNALKYTPEGRVEVRFSRSDPKLLRVHVEDTGLGIPPEDRERVFEPFVQLENPYTRAGGGTGLGLPICRRLARLLGGDVTLESTPGEGSTFTLHLPRGR